jgi:hypothetical protein
MRRFPAPNPENALVIPPVATIRTDGIRRS